MRGQSYCPGPDGFNWCARTDSRILAGWTSKGTVGFLWNAKQGGGFPYPYVEGATFDTENLNYTGRISWWNSDYAFEYPSVSPNLRGDLGVSFDWGGGVDMYPNHGVGLFDSDSGGGWELVANEFGTNGPLSNTWGDYNRIRPYYPNGTTFVASGHTLQGGNTGDYVEPQFIIFGRERDNPFPSKIKGDINGDKAITSSDALLYLRYAVGQNISPFIIVPSEDDVTCTEIPPVITAGDALKVLRKAVNQPVSLECPIA